MIPILELSTQYQQIRQEIEQAVSAVLASTHYVLGPQVTAFEQEFAQWNGSGQALGCASGTDALLLALRALDIGPGQEVLAPAFTFMATGGAISLSGATPVFCDIDPDSYALDPQQLEAKITPRTRAIVVVHLYGHPAEMQPILELAQRRGLKVIEDCAQATGASYQGRKVGTMGDLGCFSFFPSKNLGGVGDGGMILTSQPHLAQRLVALRNHGSSVKYYHQELGYNSRLDELQAAVLRVKLRHLEGWNRQRQAIAAHYDRELLPLQQSGLLQLPRVAPGCQHVYHQYTLRTSEREALAGRLQQQGIGAVVYYPQSLHLQQVYADLGYRWGDLPASEAAQQEVLSLPMFPELSSAQIEQVVGAVHQFAATAAAN